MIRYGLYLHAANSELYDTQLPRREGTTGLIGSMIGRSTVQKSGLSIFRLLGVQCFVGCIIPE